MNRAPFGPNGPFQVSERERLFAEMEQRQATGWASFAPGEHSCAKGGPCLCKKGQADQAGGCGGCRGKGAVRQLEAMPMSMKERNDAAGLGPAHAAAGGCASRTQALASAEGASGRATSAARSTRTNLSTFAGSANVSQGLRTASPHSGTRPWRRCGSNSSGPSSDDGHRFASDPYSRSGGGDPSPPLDDADLFACQGKCGNVTVMVPIPGDEFGGKLADLLIIRTVRR